MSQKRPMNLFCRDGIAVQLSSPIGVLNITGCEKGMHAVERDNNNMSTNKPDLDIECNVISSNSENLPKPVQDCIDWFEQYFTIDKRTCASGTGPVMSGQHPPICPKLGIQQFSWNVYKNVASEVKFGSRTSYSALADTIGHPNAARSVGTSLKNNPFTIIIPCHRVIPKSGGIGFYAGGSECVPLKKWLLDYEESCLSK